MNPSSPAVDRRARDRRCPARHRAPPPGLVGTVATMPLGSRSLGASSPSSGGPSDAALLQTLPGVGPHTAGTLLGALGSFTRFANARALVAYVGFYPVISQSGERSRTCRPSARASPGMCGILPR